MPPRLTVGAGRRGLTFKGLTNAPGRLLRRCDLVLAYRDLDGELHDMTACPATGRALRLYIDGSTS